VAKYIIQKSTIAAADNDADADADADINQPDDTGTYAR
jgi:hypothetical protein